MRILKIGLVVLIGALLVTAGVAAANSVVSTASDETSMDEQQEECEAMMGGVDDCPMADGGMMGMMHGDGMEECQEMADGEMSDEMMEECREIMDDGGMMGNMMNGSGMGCH